MDENLVIDLGLLQTSRFSLRPGKILSNNFQCPCDSTNTFQVKRKHNCFRVFLVCLSLRVPQAFLWGGKVMLVLEIIYLFFDLQVIFYGQMISIINSILF